MKRCTECQKEFDEKIAAGICPYCGNSMAAIRETVPFFERNLTGYGNGEQMPVENDEYEVMETPDARWLPIGTILNNRYKVCRVLGSGGFGITYQVWDTQNQVYKAVKEYFQQGVVNRISGTTEVLISAPKKREEFYYGRERLLREARIVAQFQSPSIVRVDDHFEENNTAYMVMEYLDMQTLEQYILDRKQVLEPEQAINIGVRICEALDEIHSAGVLHRDISPDNIFVTDDADMKVKIVDFGSARLAKNDVADQLVAIKPGFAPPEQYEWINLDEDRQQAWTDIYALGATLYFALTGEVPAESMNRKSDLDNDRDCLRYPNEINANVPEFLSNAIMTAMAINIHERFQNTSQMKAALLHERKVLPVEVVRKKKKIKRAFGIGTSVALILALAFAGVWRYFDRKNEAVLDEAVVSIWYSVPDDDTLAQQKTNAFEAMKAELAESDKFSAVEIELTAIPENEYSEMLEERYCGGAGVLPTIFESNDANAVYMADEDAVNLINIGDASKSCYFIRGTGIRVPTGFHIPVIYINTALVQDSLEGLTVSAMDDLMALCEGEMAYKPMAVHQELVKTYEKMLPGFEVYSSAMEDNTIDTFLNGETVLYFSDTSEYYTIRDTMQSGFKMIPLAVDEVICRFCDYWSLGSGDDGQKTAAQEILEYFYSNNFQDQYYVQTNLPGLPLEKAAVAQYAWVTRSFESLLTDLSGYTFE